jgi:hypothetical protein
LSVQLGRTTKGEGANGVLGGSPGVDDGLAIIAGRQAMAQKGLGIGVHFAVEAFRKCMVERAP